jgi:catechol 2,3-dioxygenase-like lactoylglutathione lyase family enzyme
MTGTPKTRGLTHVTLAVGDLDRAVKFYVEGLGLAMRKRWAKGAYLEAGSLWLALSPHPLARREAHPDYTHLAFDVSQADFAAMVRQLLAAGARTWKDNRSEGDSFYFLDPDGHKLEIHVGNLETRLKSMERQNE